jgi:uncharacterized protein (TIGR02246 family)
MSPGGQPSARELIAAYFAGINGEDWEGVAALFAPDALVLPAGGRPRRGRAEIARYYAEILAPFPVHHDEPVRVVVSGGDVTVEIAFEGGLANGRTVAFDALNVYRLEGGRIARLTQWYDTHRVRRLLLEAQAAGPADGHGDEGAEPRLGSVARITPERLRAALALVRRGVAFRLDLPLGALDPPLFGREPMRHAIVGVEDLELAWDDRVDALNTQQVSHWDALRHLLRPDGAGYGGRPPEDLGIDLWSRGIAGRAVLVDLEEGLGLAWDERREVSGAEVEACAARQGVDLREGDVLLLRTGWLGGHLGLPAARRPPEPAAPGLAPDEATARWLEERRFAAVAADNPGLEAVPTPPQGQMLHDRMLPGQGLAVGELWWLDDLRDDCRATGVWEGLLVSVPLNLPGACASPANAVLLK